MTSFGCSEDAEHELFTAIAFPRDGHCGLRLSLVLHILQEHLFIAGLPGIIVSLISAPLPE